MQGYQETVLFWLHPSHTNEEDVQEDIDHLRKIIKDARFFNDRDQCIETLPSIVDQTIFLILGPGHSDLVDILAQPDFRWVRLGATFDYLEYIYLQEPPHSPYKSQVRGVFPQVKQLFHQLEKDIKTVRNTHTHLHISSSGDLQQPQLIAQNLQLRAVEFKWRQLIFDVILNTDRPTENIHKDLLDECRLIYRGNKTQTGLIDKFEAEYEPSKAIWWYTCDTFLYRLLNMALRTENVLIIWKFRYVIQDIYQQLKSMYEEQKNTLIGNQQQCIFVVYRGQLVSTSELEELRNAIGGCIATTSFFSTTRNHEVAHSFSGGGIKPSDLEMVMFEIYIEQTGQEKRRPFADIRRVSFSKDEEEILLCMSTVLRVESMELVDGINRIRLRTCPYDDSAWQHPEVDLVSHESAQANDETYALLKLGCLLISMGEYKKAEQLFKMSKLSTSSVLNEMRQYLLRMARFGQKKLSDHDYTSNALVDIREMQKFFQLLADCESMPDIVRQMFKVEVQNYAVITESLSSKNMNALNSVVWLQYYNQRMENTRKYIGSFASPPMQLPLINIKVPRLFSTPAESNDEQMNSEMYDKFRLNIGKTLAENGLSRSLLLLEMVQLTFVRKDFARAIALAREGLTMTSRDDIHVELHKIVVQSYQMLENSSAVIESCQSIIDMPHIPPNSPSLAQAHMDRGDACKELGDLSEAIISYINALQLQEQHQTPHHPLTGEINIKIGDVFNQTEDMSTALEYYHKAISSDVPEISSKAYQQIGVIYVDQRIYDLARSNLMKCLEIRQTSMPHETLLLACTYIWLFRVEHRCGCIAQRDLYIQQARAIAICDDHHRDFILKQISEILAETVPITS